jgi:hypothetical protein
MAMGAHLGVVEVAGVAAMVHLPDLALVELDQPDLLQPGACPHPAS